MDLSNRVISERRVAPFRLSTAVGDFGSELRQFLQVLGDRRTIILATMGIVTVLTGLVVFQLTPLFTAKAQVLIEPKQNKILDVQAMFSGLTPEAGEVESQVHVIKSQALLDRLVDKLDLMNDAEFNPKIKPAGFVGTITKTIQSWLPSGKKPAGPDAAAQAYITLADQQARERADVMENVADRLKVVRNETTLVIDINFTSLSASKASRIANTLADLYLVDQLETKFEQTRIATNWLSERLRDLSDELQASEQKVEAFKAEHQLMGSSTGITLDKEQFAGLQTKLVEARIAREQAEVKFQQLSEMLQSDGGNFFRLSRILNSEQLTKLRGDEGALAAEEANLSARYQARHPAIVTVRSKLDGLRAEMANEARRIFQEQQNDVLAAKATERALEERMGQQQVKSAGQDQLGVKLRQLELEAQINREVFSTYQEKFKSLANQDEIQQSDARIISHAIVPLHPSFPKKKLFVAGGMVFGLLLGVTLALLIERLDNGVRTAHQLESLSGLRNIAVVPTVGDENGLTPQNYVLRKPLSAYSEAIRSVSNSILLAGQGEAMKVVVVTSTLPGEGKSTVSVALARLAAKSGKRVLLMDADLRRPTIHAQFDGIEWRNTVIDVIEGKATLEESLHSDPDSGLFILPARDGGDLSPDLVNSEGMRTLIRAAAQQYDLVVIDSPPVLPVADSLVLSRHADGVLYVVRWEATPRDAIGNGLQSLADAGANLIGTALTQVDFDRYTRYSYGDAGSHYRRYQGYYTD